MNQKPGCAFSGSRVSRQIAGLPIETAAGFRYLRHAAGMNSRSIG